MPRSILLIFLFFACLLMLGFAPANDPNLRGYTRVTINKRLDLLEKAGKDRFNRRLYEEAIEIFKAMLILDEGNLDAFFWISKCRERVKREESEKRKAELYRKKGSLVIKESKYDNWIWGPTAGHFEIRISKPKPRIIPPKKNRPRVGDAELLAFKKKADSGVPKDLFELAMSYKSRGEFPLAIESYSKAVAADPKILQLDDEGLTGELCEKFQKQKEKGTISPQERLQAATIGFLQGDLVESIIDFIKASSHDNTLKLACQDGLEKILGTGKTDFLVKPPEILSFRQAYLWENGEDSIYLKIRFRPNSPVFLIPFDLPLEYANVKTVENRSTDIICIIPDKRVDTPLRLWIACKDSGDSIPIFELKAVIRLRPAKVMTLDFSNYYAVPSEIEDNWSVVFGDPSTYSPGFPKGDIESNKAGLIIKAFDLTASKGKGPNLDLRDFRRNLGSSINPWKTFEEILPKTF
ncbi:MAG: hypothetical protein HQM08_10745 [Candidatus Riflebacteria bacterium]|nr:hypothetical protein [Candidatus Riflebacteria bacterium]